MEETKSTPQYPQVYHGEYVCPSCQCPLGTGWESKHSHQCPECGQRILTREESELLEWQQIITRG